VTGPTLAGPSRQEDAAIAVEHGADAIIVSNHGGREEETMRATVDSLPEVVAGARGRRRARRALRRWDPRPDDQLYDIQHGSRAGFAAQLMKVPVTMLTGSDTVAIAAYTASLRP